TTVHLRFSFPALLYHQTLHSFPTRRSSDLILGHGGVRVHAERDAVVEKARVDAGVEFPLRLPPEIRVRRRTGRHLAHQHHAQHRSEEHTSELQSPYDIVCRLLLEKKK